MTSKRTLLAWLAALALAVTACGGGDAGPAPLAAADVPIVPEVAGDAPPPAEGEEIVEEGDPVDGEEPAAEAAPVAEEPESVTHDYAGELERAATMMVVPADLGDALPDLRLDAARTGPMDVFSWYRRNAAGDAVTSLPPVAGYGAVLVGLASDEARERLGSPHPEVSMVSVEIEVYGDAAAADARLAELRASYGESAAVADQPGVAGDGFVAHAEDGGIPTVSVNLSGHGTVGRVVAYGTTSPDPAVAVAQALGMRMWKASEGMLAPRDPLAEATGYQPPSAALTSFEASSDVVVSVDGLVLERDRWTGKYDGLDRFSCQQTHYLDGTEELVTEVVAAGGEASVFDLATLSSGKHDLLSPEVAAAVAGCPVFADAWREYSLPEPSLLQVEPASTMAGPGTALRTRDEWRLARAVDVEPDDGGELEDFSIFVTEDGWATAIHFVVSFPPEAAAERYGIAERVRVQTSLKVTAVDGVEVPEPLYFGGDDDAFSVGVGEVVAPPAEPAEGGDGDAPAADAGEPGDGAGTGDVEATAFDDGLFGSGEFVGGSGSGDGHFSDTTPVGGAEDVAVQEAIRATMVGLLAYYIDNGDYRATPSDLAFYASGVVTTDDPGQAASAMTVYVPGDQETVVWAAGGSGYFCLAASANEIVVYGEGTAVAAVDTFAECVEGGSTVGW